MTEENERIEVENVPEEYKKTLEWINTLKKPELIKELEKRKLSIIGTVSELKIRLFWEFLPLSETNQHKSNSKIVSNNINMNNKKLFFKPTIFSGGINERVDSFLKTFNRAANINNWADEDKPQYLVAFLQGAALTFYDNIESKNLPWKELEKRFREEFEPIAQNDMLRILLERRKQADDEPTVVFLNEVESLCRRIDSNMSEGELVRNIMRGLKPSIARYIGILDNNNIDQLKKNIHKYEMLDFLITGETVKSPFEIKQSIINEKINQITKSKETDEIKKLNSEIELLKKNQEQFFEQINFMSNNTQYQNNNKINNPFQYNQYQNNDKLNNDFRNNQFQYNNNMNSRFRNYQPFQNNYRRNFDYSRNDYDRFRNNNRSNNYPPNHFQNTFTNYNENLNNYQNKPNFYKDYSNNQTQYQKYTQNKNNLQQEQKQNTQWPKIDHHNYNTNTHNNYKNPSQNVESNNYKCNFCFRNNHSSKNCFYKDNQVICQNCNSVGHTSLSCRKNSKNVN